MDTNKAFPPPPSLVDLTPVVEVLEDIRDAMPVAPAPEMTLSERLQSIVGKPVVFIFTDGGDDSALIKHVGKDYIEHEKEGYVYFTLINDIRHIFYSA